MVKAEVNLGPLIMNGRREHVMSKKEGWLLLGQYLYPNSVY